MSCNNPALMTSYLYHDIHIMGFIPEDPGICQGASLEKPWFQRSLEEQTVPPNRKKTRITNSTPKVVQSADYPGSQLTILVLFFGGTAHSQLKHLQSRNGRNSRPI